LVKKWILIGDEFDENADIFTGYWINVGKAKKNKKSRQK